MSDSAPPPPQDPNASSPPPPPPPPMPAAAPPPPPGAAVGPRPAELLDRFLAKLIDGVIMAVVYLIVVVLIVAGLIASGGTSSFVGTWISGAISGIALGLIWVGYYSFLESSRGQTIGKMVMKLKVVGPDGTSNPTMEQAVRRNLYYAGPVLAIIPIIGGLIGYLIVLVGEILCAVGISNDPQHQHWFDKFAGGTKVLKVG